MKTENFLPGRIATHGEIAEIKRIYSSIETSLKHEGSSCLVVTSSIAGEGKTTIVAGLAAYAARLLGEKVLAMDLNWYSPALHSYFGVELNLDSERLRSFESIRDVVKPSGAGKLDIFPSIRSDSTRDVPFGEYEAIAVNLIRKAREEYSVVIIDTSAVYPPNRRMIDPAIIAREADGGRGCCTCQFNPAGRCQAGHQDTGYGRCEYYRYDCKPVEESDGVIS